MPKMTFYAHNKSGTNFFINGFDPPPPVYNNYKKTDVLVLELVPKGYAL